MVSNQFFVKRGPYPLKEIIKAIDYSNDYSHVKDFKIHGVESLINAKENDMTFLNSSRYKDVSLKTKAAACITSSNLSKFLPNKCIILNVRNVLFAVNQVSRMFYPEADTDYPDLKQEDKFQMKACVLCLNYRKLGISYFHFNICLISVSITFLILFLHFIFIFIFTFTFPMNNKTKSKTKAK